LSGDVSRLNLFSDKATIYLNMFSPLLKYKILGNKYSNLIITYKSHVCEISKSQFFKQLLEPDGLTDDRGYNSILCFCIISCYYSLPISCFFRRSNCRQ